MTPTRKDNDMTLAKILSLLRSEPPIDYETASTKAGCTVRRLFRDADRYLVDFDPDFKRDGWQQFDTEQDAHYFGVWLNPGSMVILTYCEGDWDLQACHDKERYLDAVQRLIDFYQPGKIATAIGPDGVVTYRQDRSEFLKMEDADPGSIADVL